MRWGPVAWDPGYPTAPCSIGTGGGGTCTTPGDFDLILETSTGSGVNWIRYQLQNGTLYRAVVPKMVVDPVTATSAAGVMVPFLTNVLNIPGAQLTEITATYPTMFPLGQPVPIFQYSCDSGVGTVPCPGAGTVNSPANIRDVDITLIVATTDKEYSDAEINDCGTKWKRSPVESEQLKVKLKMKKRFKRKKATHAKRVSR